MLRNGVIHTLDPQASVAEAMAVQGGAIVAVGSNAEIAHAVGAKTAVVDLGGRAVIPGINDGHIHAVWLGAFWPDLLLESAGRQVTPLRSADDRRRALIKAFGLMASLGITSYTEPGIGPGEDGGPTGCFGTSVLETYLDIAASAQQTARVTLLRLYGVLDGPSRFEDVKRGLAVDAPRTDPRWLAIPGVKIFADGIPPMRSAWLRTPYLDGSYGALLTGEGDDGQRLAEFSGMVELAHRRGLQVAVHATGDRTIEEFIGIVERLGGAGDLRHYIIHGDLIDAAQLQRMKQLGIGIAVQPLVAGLAKPWMAQALPPELTKDAFPLHLMLDADLNAILSSDAPVASPDWRKSLAAAAQQLEDQGVRVGRDELTRLLAMYTRVPAVQDGALDWKGTIEVGKVADLCVLDADPYVVGAAGMADVAIAMTIVDGRIVYRGAGPH